MLRHGVIVASRPAPANEGVPPIRGGQSLRLAHEPSRNRMKMENGVMRFAGSVRTPAAGPAIAALAGVAVALVGLVVSTPHRPYPWSVWAPVQCVGLSFVVAGAVGWWRQPANGTGRLMTAVGITWYVGDLQVSAHPVLFAVGFCGFYLCAAVFTHLILALPTGHIVTRSERWLVAGMYTVVTSTQVLRYLVEYPVQPQIWGTADGRSVWAPIGSVAAGACTVAAFCLVVRRWRTARRPARRHLSALWMAGAAGGAISLIWTGVVVSSPTARINRWLLCAFAVALILVPFAVLAGVLRIRLARLQVANLVVRLDAIAEPERLRDALADALGDPALQVWFPLHGGGYTDPVGHIVADPARHGAATTPVECRGEHLAVLVHDPALLNQRQLVEAVIATARLALENAGLHAAQRAQLEEVRASRARIVAAADDERRRIQRDLHDGVQHQLLAIAVLVRRVHEELGQLDGSRQSVHHLDTAANRLHDVIRELRELTEGINPPALTEQGLGAVLETLAERAPIPVEYEAPPRRWPAPLERTAYFLINEALANIYKHARASHACVTVTAHSHGLTVRVADDGCGGADLTRGSGLRGLYDRVAAVNGTLRLESPPGRGTTIEAELPCES
ncbi:sensor histidine kinase [Nucisporomicrobium flavum]|nr:sensor histidine kinase [Nucisporomicrobium flavum]